MGRICTSKATLLTYLGPGRVINLPSMSFKRQQTQQTLAKLKTLYKDQRQIRNTKTDADAGVDANADSDAFTYKHRDKEKYEYKETESEMERQTMTETRTETKT